MKLRCESLLHHHLFVLQRYSAYYCSLHPIHLDAFKEIKHSELTMLLKVLHLVGGEISLSLKWVYLVTPRILKKVAKNLHSRHLTECIAVGVGFHEHIDVRRNDEVHHASEVFHCTSTTIHEQQATYFLQHSEELLISHINDRELPQRKATFPSLSAYNL